MTPIGSVVGQDVRFGLQGDRFGRQWHRLPWAAIPKGTLAYEKASLPVRRLVISRRYP